MVKRALKRDAGPESRAKEFNPELIQETAWEGKLQGRGMPTRATWAYGWAVLWMLRYVELVVNLRASDISLGFKKLTVTINIRKSKADQAALGVKRTLQMLWQTKLRQNVPLEFGSEIVGGPRKREHDHAAVWGHQRHTDPEGEDDKSVDGMCPRRTHGTLCATKWRNVVCPQGHARARDWVTRAMEVFMFRYIEEAPEEIPLNAAVSGDRESDVALR